MCEIKNTIKFTFSNGSEKPDIADVVNFVKSLDADPGQIEAAYRMAEEKSLFIKFKCEESMLHALTFNSEDLIFHYANGKKAKVRMSHAQEYIFYVRIYDLPPEVPDHELALVLGKYGKVKRVVREKFPVELGLDAYTGVRGVYMDVKKEIPTSLHFLNRKGNIFYPGNKDKCFLCKEDGHHIDSCPRRKARKQPEKRRQEKEQSGSSTYAGAVTGDTVADGAVIGEAEAGGAQTDNSHREIIEETIEVLEEEMLEATMAPTASVAEISDEKSADENHPVYQLVSHIAGAIKKKNEEEKTRLEKEFRRKAKDEEESKIKSPPRKKKNFSLYSK